MNSTTAACCEHAAFIQGWKNPQGRNAYWSEACFIMVRMRRIKVMADYDCWPLWHDGPPNGDVGDIDPLTLPIDPSLQARLLEWADAYGALLDRDNPAATLPPQSWFDQEGRQLALELQLALGETIRVRYWKDKDTNRRT